MTKAMTMKAAGKMCRICDQKVLFEAEGTGCPACDQVWHRDCLEDSSKCPLCAAVLSRESAGLLRPGKVAENGEPRLVNVKMQRCGKPCIQCGDKVLVEPESSGCPACGLVWHLGCHTPANRCPKCGEDVEKVSRFAESAKVFAFESRRSAGKTIYGIMLGIRTLGAGIDIIAAGLLRDVSDSARKWVFIMIAVAWVLYLGIWILAWLGVRGARIYLGVGAAIVLVWNLAASHVSPGWVVPALLAHGFSVWACFFSRNVKLHEASFVR